jgi:hypothetical protein
MSNIYMYTHVHVDVYVYRLGYKYTYMNICKVEVTLIIMDFIYSRSVKNCSCCATRRLSGSPDSCRAWQHAACIWLRGAAADCGNSPVLGPRPFRKRPPSND